MAGIFLPFAPPVIALDGVSSYLSIASAAVSTTPLTLGIWCFGTPPASSPPYVFQIKNSASAININCWQLLVNANQTMSALTASGTASASAASAEALTSGRWNYLAATFASAADRTAWMNGRPGTTNTTSRTPASVNSTTIGKSLNASDLNPRYFNGALAHAAIWNAALTATEMKLLASGVLPSMVKRENLVSYWPLTLTGIQPGHDYMNAFDLALTGPMGTARGPFQRRRNIYFDAVAAGKPYIYYAMQQRQAA
jgi:hypothetical protein